MLQIPLPSLLDRRQPARFLAKRGYGVLLGLLLSLLMYASFFFTFSLPGMVFFGLIGGLVGGLIGGGEGMTFRFSRVAQEWKRRWMNLALLSGGCALFIGISTGYAFSLFGDGITAPYSNLFGLSAAICTFLLCGIIEAGKSALTADAILPKQHRPWWERWLFPGLHTAHLRLGALVGGSLGLSVGLSYMLSIGVGLTYDLRSALNYGLSYSCGGIILSLLLLEAKRGITLTEIVTWSLPRLAQSLFSKAHLRITVRLFLLTALLFGLSAGLSNGLIVALGGGLYYGLSYGLSTGLPIGLSYGVSTGLSVGLSYALIYWLLSGIQNSFFQEILDDHRRNTPNQGVKRFVYQRILLGLLAGILCGLVILVNSLLNDILFCSLGAGLSNGLNYLLSNGLSIWLVRWSNGLDIGLRLWLSGWSSSGPQLSRPNEGPFNGPDNVLLAAITGVLLSLVGYWRTCRTTPSAAPQPVRVIAPYKTKRW